jgi:hypothetical protein
LENHLIALQPVVERLTECTGLSIYVKPEREAHEVRKEALAERPRHAPFCACEYETSDFAH